MFTTVAFYENIDPAGAFAPIAGVADQHVRVVGDDIQVPNQMNKIILAAGMIENTVAPRARLTAPSLRRLVLPMLAPLNVAGAGAVEPNSPQRIIDRRLSPLELESGEQLNAEIFSNPAAAQDQSVVAWLGDGVIQPVTGKIFTVRATGATTLVAGAWGNTPLTFDEDLPRGRYQIVGMRPESAGCVAARCVFVGGGPRPGALGCDGVDDIQADVFRHGNLGVFGEFEDNEPPTVDFLSISADTAEVVYFDLIQVRQGGV